MSKHEQLWVAKYDGSFETLRTVPRALVPKT